MICSEGYYTDEEEPYDTKTAQHICPKGYWCENGLRHPCEAGLFGDTLGSSDAACSGICLSGYYCPSGSTSPHQLPCGNSTVYCPDGSSVPTLVDEGYYSSLENGAVTADYYAGPNATQQIQGKRANLIMRYYSVCTVLTLFVFSNPQFNARWGTIAKTG